MIASKVNLDARMAAAAGFNHNGMIINPSEFANDNASNGLTSFLQDNLLLSDANMNKQVEGNVGS